MLKESNEKNDKNTYLLTLQWLHEFDEWFFKLIKIIHKGLSVNEDYNYFWTVHSFDVENIWIFSSHWPCFDDLCLQYFSQ